MKPANLVVLMLTTVLCLTLIVTAQQPQQDQPEPGQPQMNQDQIEAAHDRLLPNSNKATEASRLTQSLASQLPATGASYAPIARKNFVDEHIFGRIERDKIPHAALAGDSEFLRRAYLDATGLLPTADQVRSFLADTDANKRDKLIDSLIGTEEFANQWAYHYGELMRTRETAFHDWTKTWLKLDRPYNDVFYDMVTPLAKNVAGSPTGSTFYDAIGYIANRCSTWTDPDYKRGFNRLDWIDEMTSDIGRVFLGISMDCFSCHNGAGHADSLNLFLTGMKRTDFWQQAAFFGKMRNIGQVGNAANGLQHYGGSSMYDNEAPGYNTGDDGTYFTPSEGRFPRDGKTYQPSFLLTGEKPKPGEDPRKALGRILPTHPQFSNAAVNIIWQKLMVVGLVEPYDGFDLKRLDPKNPPPAPWTLQPANPELLLALAEDFRDHNYSIHRVIKTIMKSNAYQLSTLFEGEWKDDYIPYYARRFARVLTAVEAVDIISQATGAPHSFRGNGDSYKYVQQLGSPLSVGKGVIYGFMQAYYQKERSLPPEDKSATNPVQAMMMMSSPVVTERVSAEGKTNLANLLKAGASDDLIIEELYLAGLSRRPTADELEVAKRVVAEKDRKKSLESIQWLVLNSPEFLLNH